MKSIRQPTAILGGMLLVATIATIGSLYLSLGLGLVPCELCWYQRILMYPLVPLLGYAIYDDIDYTQSNFALLIGTYAGLGLLLSGYHSYIQFAPESESVCSSACAIVLYTVGPFSIPNLSFIAFALIGIGCVLYHRL